MTFARSILLSVRDGVLIVCLMSAALVAFQWSDYAIMRPSRECRLSFDRIEEYDVLVDVCRSGQVREMMSVEQDLHDMALIDEGVTIGAGTK